MDKNEIKSSIGDAVKILTDNKKEYIGQDLRSKMSAFGATIIMNGLVPAIAGYKKSERKSVVELICKMAAKKDKEVYNVLNTIQAKGYVGEDDEQKATDAVLDYVVAYKLAFDMLENRDE